MGKTISINRLCRVEGYGGISVDSKDGKLERVRLNILEGARFIEQLIVGKRYDEIPEIVCRICAICSAVHKLTSIQALEKALALKVSSRDFLLRDLLLQGGNIESHALHVYCLALPDFLGMNSIAELAAQYSDQAALGLKLKKLGNMIQELIGGRAIHPVNARIGGFGKYPDIDSLKALKVQLLDGLDNALKSIEFLKSIEIPDYWGTPGVFSALKPIDQDFSFFGDQIITSQNNSISINDYPKLTNEYVVHHSNAKHSKNNKEPFMVGALARINLNSKRLKGKARFALDSLGLSLYRNNILFNNWAQVVEIVYAIERSLEICDILIKKEKKQEKNTEIRVRAGVGTGAIEAPRGTLYHSYTLNNDGYITSADIITPTAQNLANIEKDLYETTKNIFSKSKQQVKRNLEMVVRAYDPCISCSVH